MNLVVGATGLVGGEVCRLLAERGAPVRALARDTAQADKLAQLRAAGAELAHGDLKDRESLARACAGVDVVLSTASSTLSRQAGDSIHSVDERGQLDLIDVAEAAGVKRFIFVSFPHVPFDFPLQSAKRAVEERLARARMSCIVLQPTFFTEVWLSPALGFDAAHASATIYGTGQNKISWISFQDVAQSAVAAVGSAGAGNRVIKLGGPEALSPLDVVRKSEEIVGKRFAVQHVPEEALRAQFDAAADPLQQSFAGLMRYYALGDVIDMTDARQVLAVRPFKSVRDHIRVSLAAPGPAA